MKKSDKIFLFVNIIFIVWAYIYLGGKYDIVTMNLSEFSGKIQILCIIFLLISYIAYTIIKKILYKNNNDKKNINNNKKNKSKKSKHNKH